MLKHGVPLMDKPAVARLRRAECGVLARALAGQAGVHGLVLSVDSRTVSDGPRMGCLTRLVLDGEIWHGDVRSRVDESLPFIDEAFRVVVIEHVLEWTVHAAALLDEAARVLAGDGALVVCGFHPFSPWLPWLLCRRAPRPMLTPPGWIRQRLAMQGVDILQVQRCGSVLPVSGGSTMTSQGGGFVLVARKQRASIMPLHLAHRSRQKKARAPAVWAPGTHRECA